ncbi:enoyl-CoA hydratase-related protein [Rhodococcus sp. NM-2]|uniref:enoyl-CoA hydratase-related protein n=1 Tax=Rhodococcus sp. NM-2 TaxID=3401174 RepID=UPI003AAF01B3
MNPSSLFVAGAVNNRSTRRPDAKGTWRASMEDHRVDGAVRIGADHRAENRLVEDSDKSVLWEVREGVALITLNRPHRLNALTVEMRTRYLSLLHHAGQDEAVRAIVVTGAGRGFCAGADFKALEGVDGQVLRDRQAAEQFPIDMARRIAKPVIAAVNGPAAGVGFAHALMADIRFASSQAVFTTSFAKLGLVAEAGTSWLLPRLIGSARALDLLWSGRKFSASEALSYGVVQSVWDPDELLERTLEYAHLLANGSSAYSIATIKEQVAADWSSSWADALERSHEKTVESFSRPEFAARVRAAARG